MRWRSLKNGSIRKGINSVCYCSSRAERGRHHRGCDKSAELLGCRRINLCGNSGDTIRRKASTLGVLQNQFFIRCDVNAVDLVVSHVAMDPLNVGSELIEGDAGPRRPGVQLVSVLLVAQRRPRGAHHSERRREEALQGEVVERGDELALREITGAAEDDDRRGLGDA